jgi:hypothetical protein
MKELSQNLGAAYGRLITECMMPLVNRILYVMDEQNLLDMPLKADGKVVRIVPVSPLAQAQNMEDLQNVLQFAQIAAGAGPMGQVAINQDAMVDYIIEKMGVPRSVVNSAEQREQIVAEMQSAMTQIQQGQQTNE